MQSLQPFIVLQSIAPRRLIVGRRRNCRRGRLPIEARLDLHGMTQATAERTLTDFVQRMAGDGRRNLLVITGQGYPARRR